MKSSAQTVEQDGLRVVIAPATVRQGMMRTRLIAESQIAPETDPDRALLRRFSYPDCVAAATSAEGIQPWPPDFETYLTLPDEFCARWEQAVYSVNPHWAPGYERPKAATSPPPSTSG